MTSSLKSKLVILVTAIASLVFGVNAISQTDTQVANPTTPNTTAPTPTPTVTKYVTKTVEKPTAPAQPQVAQPTPQSQPKVAATSSGS